MNTYIKTLLDSFGNQLFPRTRVDAVYLEDNTTELGDHLQTKQDAPTLDKTTPVDGDKALIYDSADSNAPKKLSWANIKAILKTYFDTLYAAITHGHSIGDVANLQATLDGKSGTAHLHDDRYYTETEVDALISIANKVTNQNLVTNGDFSNGITGWTAGGSSCTLEVASNTLSAIGTGILSTPNLYQTTSFVPISGRKIYTIAKVRVTNAECIQFNMHLGDNTVGLISQVQQVLAPTNGAWYTLSNVVQLTTHAGFLRIYLYSGYADTSTANGKVMEVQYVQALDLTSIFGAGKEPTKEQMDAVFELIEWTDSPNHLHYASLTGTTTAPNIVTNGIKFPAFQVPSADPNTLDDYEEGTFSPTIVGLTTQGTGNVYALQSSAYTKIGNLATCFGRVSLSTKGNGTGGILIGGLPFTPKGITARISAKIPNVANVTGISIDNLHGTYMYASGGQGYIVLADSAGSIIDFSKITNASMFDFYVSYPTD